jgi:hypothetical protein
MKVGDKVKVICENSMFIGKTAIITRLVSKEGLFFIVFDDSSVTLYKGLHFLESELEVIENESETNL